MPTTLDRLLPKVKLASDSGEVSLYCGSNLWGGGGGAVGGTTPPLNCGAKTRCGVGQVATSSGGSGKSRGAGGEGLLRELIPLKGGGGSPRTADGGGGGGDGEETDIDLVRLGPQAMLKS